VAGRIENSIGSIGYVGFEFASKLGLKMAILENKEGNFVRPTDESSAAALSGADLPENLRVFLPDPSGPNSYPIVTLSWILLYRHYGEPEKARAIQDPFRWCLQDGQKYAAQVGYVPLPSNVGTKALAALDASRQRE
jgi:phosphate transport system substrate-binding protein